MNIIENVKPAGNTKMRIYQQQNQKENFLTRNRESIVNELCKIM